MEQVAAVLSPRAVPPAPLLFSIAKTAKQAGPAFPEPTLRDLVYHSEPRLGADGETKPANGFAVCVVRINGRVLIDWDRFLGWIESNRGRGSRSRRSLRAA
jgi:hypothetical protein